MRTAQPTLSTWQRAPVAALPKSGPLAYVRGLAFTVWMISLLFGFWYITDWGTHQELFAEGFDMKTYFFVGFGVMLAAQLTLGLPAWLAAPFQMISTPAGAILTVFCFLMAVLSPLSVVPLSSLLYAGATLVSAIMLWLYWTENYRVMQRSLLVACWAQFAWWSLLLLRHGQPHGFGFNIGDINRNMTGTAALAALLCGLFTPNRYLRWAAFGAAAFFIVIVTSRGSIVALTVFVIVYTVLQLGVFRAAARFSLLLIAIAMIVLIVPQLRETVLEQVFRVHDRARGIGSGFTGRWDMWVQGLEWFWRKPVFGYGFRATTHSRGVGFGGVHSAYIKIFLEAGLIGGLLIIGVVAVEAFRRLRLAFRLRTLRPNDLPGINIAESLRINAIACGTMCLTLTMWVYDQYYINLGSPISVMLFLMLLAPVYVTTDGRLLKR